jgi:hypothetical protein
MMFRAFLCCATLIVGLLAALNVTAQSAGACNGTACGKPAPLNLMNFMNGSGQSSTGQNSSSQAATITSTAPVKTATTKRRHHKAKTATRSNSEVTPPAAASPEPAALPATAATAYAAHSADDVQVVSGDEVNAIDLAMSNANGSATETNGSSPGAENDNRDRVKWAEANEFRTEQFKPTAAPAPAKAPTGDSTVRDDSWMGRFWSAIGDGYVALIAMIKQLFG